MAQGPFGPAPVDSYATQPGLDPYAIRGGSPLAPGPIEMQGYFSGLTDNFALSPVVIRGPARFVPSGEFLYLRASDAATTSFAVPINGAVIPPPTPAIPSGRIAATDFDMEPGFRVGLSWATNDYSMWSANYAWLDLDTATSISVDPAVPLALQSLVMHPSTAAADAFYVNANGSSSIEMRLGDLEYRRVLIENCYRFDFLVGGRYGHLNQGFSSAFTNVTTTERVNSSVDFDGGGIRFGLRGDWRSPRNGLFVYGQTTTGFLAGEFSSTYRQSDDFLNTFVNASRKDDRIINVTDVELGLGWLSRNRRWLFSSGYLFNTWDDVVNNAGWIRAVQANSYAPVRERLTFDGFVTRAEFRF